MKINDQRNNKWIIPTARKYPSMLESCTWLGPPKKKNPGLHTAHKA